MPTYEYRCPKGHEFERFQKMSDDPVAECPECGQNAERLLSGGAGFLFRGSGFYITDYRPDSYREAAKADKAKAEKPKSGGKDSSTGSGSSDGGSGGKASSSGSGD